MDPKPVHLVVRFSDTMFGVGDVVARHNEIADESGAVWFGKLGQTISETRMQMLNKQIEQAVPTYLYLVKGNRKKSTAYRAKLLWASQKTPKEKNLITAYYKAKRILQYMKAWMKIGHIEPIDMKALG